MLFFLLLGKCEAPHVDPGHEHVDSRGVSVPWGLVDLHFSVQSLVMLYLLLLLCYDLIDRRDA